MQTTIRMPVKLYRSLKELAKDRGMTLNGFVVSELWQVAERLLAKG